MHRILIFCCFFAWGISLVSCKKDPEICVDCLDDLAFKQNIVVEQEQVEALILKIQHFDPAGIAATGICKPIRNRFCSTLPT